MNKLEEYRDKEAAIYANKELSDEGNGSKSGNFYGFYSTHQDGFDAAIALDLPVKFQDWLFTVSTGSIGDQHICKDLAIELGRGKNNVGFSTKELYKYWIENIYNKPE